jgi:hypothetical protein
MKDNKMKKWMVPFLGASALMGGLVAGVASMAGAQTTTTPGTTATPTTEHMGSHGHAPEGQDGNITAISGSTITLQEEADEGGATYTVDASSATVNKDGVAAALSDLKVGDKVFIDGTVSGNNVAATSINTGERGHHDKGGDNETNDDGDQTDAQDPGQLDGENAAQ